MCDAVLHGALDDGVRLDVAVGIGDYLAVECLGFVAEGGAMFLGGDGHDLYLGGGEPFGQTWVLTNDLSGDDMMAVAAFDDAGVVVGGDGVYHVFVELGVVLSEFHALCHDALDVGEVVCEVELVVAGKYVLFHIGFEVGAYHGVGHLLEGVAGSAVGHVDDAAVGVAEFLYDVEHDVVVGVGVDPDGCSLLFAPLEDLAGDAVDAWGAGEAVDGAVGGGVVHPAAVVDGGVGGFGGVEEGEASDGGAVVLNHEVDLVGDVVEDGFGGGVVAPLRGVAVGAHDGARIGYHVHDEGQVVGCGGTYHDEVRTKNYEVVGTQLSACQTLLPNCMR